MPQAARAARSREAPDPPDEDRAAHSGRLLLRMPQSLHGELARTAEQEGVSLNAFITGVLSGAVRWRDAGVDQRRTESRLVRAAIAVDLALVAVAAIVAIVVLLAA